MLPEVSTAIPTRTLLLDPPRKVEYRMVGSITKGYSVRYVPTSNV